MNQALSLVEQLKNLEHLQELDLKIDALKKNQSSLPAHLKDIDESLSKLKNVIELKKRTHADLDKTYRQAQAALELNRERLTRSSSKLESVQNSQEFQAANKEIDQLKKLTTNLEEQEKKSIAELATLSQEITTLTEQFDKMQAQRNSESTALSGQDSQFKTDISTLTSERAQFTSKVEAKILSIYERVRPARGGLGIVPTVGGRCKGCNMMVPPQLYNEVHRGSALHSCPSCHRLLYVPSAGISPEAGS